jgi:hypothetical protein
MIGTSEEDLAAWTHFTEFNDLYIRSLDKCTETLYDNTDALCHLRQSFNDGPKLRNAVA